MFLNDGRASPRNDRVKPMSMMQNLKMVTSEIQWRVHGRVLPMPRLKLSTTEVHPLLTRIKLQDYNHNNY